MRLQVLERADRAGLDAGVAQPLRLPRRALERPVDEVGQLAGLQRVQPLARERLRVRIPVRRRGHRQLPPLLGRPYRTLSRMGARSSASDSANCGWVGRPVGRGPSWWDEKGASGHTTRPTSAQRPRGAELVGRERCAMDTQLGPRAHRGRESEGCGEKCTYAVRTLTRPVPAPTAGADHHPYPAAVRRGDLGDGPRGAPRAAPPRHLGSAHANRGRAAQHHAGRGRRAAGGVGAARGRGAVLLAGRARPAALRRRRPVRRAQRGGGGDGADPRWPR